MHPAGDAVTLLSMLKVTSGVPWTCRSAWPSAPEVQEWAAGYSGWLGVGSTGVQSASGCVASLPSSAASGMAVCGRHIA
jgi:hypothetical protein